MHIKEYNGFEIKYPGPDLHQEEILSVMDFLIQQIEKIDSYPDKSLFFQNPQIIEAWLQLVRTISKLEAWDIPEDNTEWEERTETYVTYLLTLRSYFLEYHKLYLAYFGHLKDIIEVYGGCLEGSCISKELMEVLLVEKELLDLENVNQFLTELNRDSSDTRYSVFKTLSKLFDFLSALMDSGLVKLMDLKPSIDDFAKAIGDDLREWTFSFGDSIFEGMKEDLTRHYKAYRTAPYTPELWGEMLNADEEALLMASKQQLANCNAVKQEHWGEDMKKQMDENGELMHLIYSSCRTEKLFDIGKVESSHELVALLTPDNLQIFYDIIVRRNLIQCEMFPKLKAQYEEWLNRINEQPEEVEETGMSKARQSKLDEIIRIMQNGNWKLPATAENVTQLLNTVFGKDMSLLDKEDVPFCEKMWALVERGTGERMVIIPGNLAGFFSEENLLAGSPTAISKDLFGNNKHINNINKGNSTRCSQSFTEVIPSLKKYTNKIIRQV